MVVILFEGKGKGREGERVCDWGWRGGVFLRIIIYLF